MAFGAKSVGGRAVSVVFISARRTRQA